MKKEKVERKVEEEPATRSGVYIFPNGDKYDGEYTHLEDGTVVRAGTGKHISFDGIISEGTWEGNKMNGKGVVTFPTGACYTGEIQDNMMHGNGTYVFPDRSVYEGEFQHNRLVGGGTFIDPNGQSWCGGFNNKTATNLRFKLDM